jgi:GTPase
VILVNKWDLADAVSQREYGPALSHAIPFLAHCPIVFASSSTGYNIRRSIETIDHVAAQMQARLPTGVLNRAIQDAHERVQPPAVDGKRLRIYYSTQVDVRPVHIRLFVNDPTRVKDAYTAYLIRAVREKFGLEGAPVILEFVARPRKDLRNNAGKDVDGAPPRGGRRDG